MSSKNYYNRILKKKNKKTKENKKQRGCPYTPCYLFKGPVPSMGMGTKPQKKKVSVKVF